MKEPEHKTETYYKRMDAACDDKLRILEYLHDGDRVMDFGAGSGALTKEIRKKMPHCHVDAVEFGDKAVQTLDGALCGLDGVTVLRSDTCDNAVEWFRAGTDTYDTIIFSSVIHEILSYTTYERRRYNRDIIPDLLVEVAARLNPGGRIVIRDGVNVKTRHNRTVQVRFQDESLYALAKRFAAEFKGFDLRAKPTENGFSLPYNSMMEMLYTITWGEASFPREVEEWYGYYALEDWKDLEKKLYFECGLVLVHAEKYRQPGYDEHLKDKVSVWVRNGKNPIDLPASNSLIVYKKSEG